MYSHNKRRHSGWCPMCDSSAHVEGQRLWTVEHLVRDCPKFDGDRWRSWQLVWEVAKDEGLLPAGHGAWEQTVEVRDAMFKLTIGDVVPDAFVQLGMETWHRATSTGWAAHRKGIPKIAPQYARLMGIAGRYLLRVVRAVKAAVQAAQLAGTAWEQVGEGWRGPDSRGGHGLDPPPAVGIIQARVLAEAALAAAREARRAQEPTDSGGGTMVVAGAMVVDDAMVVGAVGVGPGGTAALARRGGGAGQARGGAGTPRFALGPSGPGFLRRAAGPPAAATAAWGGALRASPHAGVWAPHAAPVHAHGAPRTPRIGNWPSPGAAAGAGAGAGEGGNNAAGAGVVINRFGAVGYGDPARQAHGASALAPTTHPSGANSRALV